MLSTSAEQECFMMFQMDMVKGPVQTGTYTLLTFTGQPSDKIYHDIADLAEVTSLPEEGHVHRDVEKAVLEAQKKFSVPTAIISPPLIHGIGKGPIKVNSAQIPMLTAAILKRGKGFQIGEGQNNWDGKKSR